MTNTTQAGQWIWSNEYGQYVWVVGFAQQCQLAYTAPRKAVTRPPFDHVAAVRKCVLTIGMYLPVYALRYAYHRLGATKSVTTWR